MYVRAPLIIQFIIIYISHTQSLPIKLTVTIHPSPLIIPFHHRQTFGRTETFEYATAHAPALQTHIITVVIALEHHLQVMMSTAHYRCIPPISPDCLYTITDPSMPNYLLADVPPGPTPVINSFSRKNRAGRKFPPRWKNIFHAPVIYYK